MGIIVDLIIIALIALSVYLGYRKGFITLAISFCTFIIAIVVTFIFYKPISNFVINVTGIDETIENAILSKTNDILQEESQGEDDIKNEIVENAKNGMLPGAARTISINIVYGGVFLILFILVKIALRFVTALANLIAKLPIINQFNKLGGILYGLLRGLLLVYVVLLLIALVAQINPESTTYTNINQSTLGKVMYENNVLNILFK